MQPSEEYSLPEDERGKDLSGRGTKATERPSKGHSHTRDGRGRDLSGHGKTATEPGALTD